MSYVDTYDIACPYCGEHFELIADSSAGSQVYIEDCTVCCRPIEVHVDVSYDESVHVWVRAEDDPGA